MRRLREIRLFCDVGYTCLVILGYNFAMHSMKRLMLCFALLGFAGGWCRVAWSQQTQKDLLRVDAPSAGATQESRIALVIGNRDYAFKPLTNPINDARAVAAMLRKLGFTVVVGENLSRSKMSDAVEAFAERLTKNSVALFYYSGHGVQMDGSNYLVPVDNAGIQRESQAEERFYPASRLLTQMARARCRLNVLVLDACRTNPFSIPAAAGSRGLEDGLAKIESPVATLIAYAAAPGRTASDNDSEGNGLYTRELLKNLPTTGISLIEVFTRTQNGVESASNSTQTPWLALSPLPTVYLAGNQTQNPANTDDVDTKATLVVQTNPADAAHQSR